MFNQSINLKWVFILSLIATIAWDLCFGLLGASIAKIVVGLGMWGTFFMIPTNLYSTVKLSKWARRFLRLLLVVAFISLGISILYPDNITPNKWTTLFGNPFCFLMMITPLFTFLSQVDNIIVYIKIYINIFLLIGLPFAISHPMGYSQFLWFFPLLFPYINKKQVILFGVAALCCVYTAFYAENTSRTNILVLLLAAINYCLVYLLCNKRLIKIVCVGLIVLPLIYSILTLIEPGFSVFQIILNSLEKETSDTQLTVDTRSFLFYELREDLTATHSWLLGKGADGHYYSPYFENLKEDGGDSFHRLTCEVTFLQLILRGGVLYAIGYYGLLISAVSYVLRRAQNRFMLSIAVMISSWIFVSCVSLLFGCSMLHVVFFALVGCCFSPYWLYKTDNDIKQLLS